MSFVNTKTGERYEATLLMHLKYFFLNEERHLGIVVCIVEFTGRLGFWSVSNQSCGGRSKPVRHLYR